MNLKRLLVPSLVAFIGAAPLLAQEGTADGVKLFEQRKYVEAEQFLTKAVAANQRDATAHAYLGLVYQNFRGEVDAAIGHLEEAVKLEPGNARYHLWLAGCYGTKAQAAGVFKALSLAKRSRLEMEKAVELDPTGLGARVSLLQFYLRVPGIAGGSVAKAREQAEAIGKISPVRGHLARAQIAEHEKDAAAAEESYRKAVTAEPGNGEGHNEFGYFLLRNKRVNEAIAEFRRYGELDPAAANPHDSLAEGLLARGQVDEAITEYQKALAADGSFTSSLSGLAQCYERKGQWRSARETWQRFLDLVPRGRRADAARERLRELEKKAG